MDTRHKRIMGMQAEIIFNQATKIQNTAIKLKNELGPGAYADVIDQVNTLVNHYNELVDKVNKLFEEDNIEEKLSKGKTIDYDWDDLKKGKLYATEAHILGLIFSTFKIKSFLLDNITLAESTINKLGSLKDELQQIKNDLPENILLNLNQAIEEFEKGGFLGSSLIAGKIIRVCLDKIMGTDINQKINLLKSLDLIRDKDGTDSLLKANHYGRNLTSHDLDIFPSSSEAICYIGEAIKIARICNDYGKNYLKEQNIKSSP